MLKKNCFFLGTVVAKYSFRGEVLIKLDTDDPSAYQSLQSLLIEQEMGLVPYFVERAKLHKTQRMITKLTNFPCLKYSNGFSIN